MKKSDICCVFNIGPHYREPIYKAMSENLNCHFYFGDRVDTDIKKFEYQKLDGFCGELQRKELFGGFHWQKGVVELINKEYTKFIVTGDPFCLSTWILAILCKLKKKKIVAWTHGWYGRENGIKKFVKKTFFKLFTHILTYNEYSLMLMKEEGFASEKLSCIANSLDSSRQKNIRENLHKTDIYTAHFENSFPIILYCGRIQKRKKINLLVDCVKKLKERNIDCNLVIVGKDVDGVDISTMVKSRGLENNVWEYGACYDEKVIGELFYNAAVCVSPGNVGLTSIHSLTYGCPVVTHDDLTTQMPEFEAIIDGVTGSFYKYGNNEDMLNKISFWLNIAEEKRETVRNTAFEEIDRKWNINSQICVLQKVLDTL